MSEYMPSYPTLTWHIFLDEAETVTVCGGKWKPPSPDSYPDVPRELCVYCNVHSLRPPDTERTER